MKITELKEPLAIAMWDSSWLRRRYAGGGFDDFDRALTDTEYFLISAEARYFPFSLSKVISNPDM